jgi:S-adenosylmethionine/arginine decarboxylase-like enzyme
MFIPNHLHLIVKGYCTTPPHEVSELNDWFTRLVEKVKMKVVAGPTSVYVADEGNEGLTGTVTLATSHGSFHCWSEYKLPMFQFDLYSCSEFSINEVINHLNEFDLSSYTYMMIDRNGDDFKIISSSHVILNQ